MSLIIRQAVPSYPTTSTGSSVVESGSPSESPASSSNTSSDPGVEGYVGLVLTVVVVLILLYFIALSKRRKAQRTQADLLQHTGMSFSMQEVNSMSGLKSGEPSRFALGRILGF